MVRGKEGRRMKEGRRGGGEEGRRMKAGRLKVCFMSAAGVGGEFTWRRQGWLLLCSGRGTPDDVDTRGNPLLLGAD